MREVFCLFRSTEHERQMNTLMVIKDKDFIITKNGKVGTELTEQRVMNTAGFFEDLKNDFFSQDQGDPAFAAIAWYGTRLFYSFLEKRKEKVNFQNKEETNKLALACFSLAVKYVTGKQPSYSDLVKNTHNDVQQLTQKKLSDQEGQIVMQQDWQMNKTTPV